MRCRCIRHVTRQRHRCEVHRSAVVTEHRVQQRGAERRGHGTPAEAHAGARGPVALTRPQGGAYKVKEPRHPRHSILVSEARRSTAHHCEHVALQVSGTYPHCVAPTCCARSFSARCAARSCRRRRKAASDAHGSCTSSSSSYAPSTPYSSVPSESTVPQWMHTSSAASATHCTASASPHAGHAVATIPRWRKTRVACGGGWAGATWRARDAGRTPTVAAQRANDRRAFTH